MILARRLTHAFALLSVLAFAACEKEPAEIANPLDASSLDAKEKAVVRYFQTIALGAEFGGLPRETFRWEGETNVGLFGSGVQDLHRAMLDTVVAGINALSTTRFKLTQDSTRGADIALFVATVPEISERYPDQAQWAADNLGYFRIQSEGNVIYKATVWIDAQLPSAAFVKSLLLEELTQALGLMNDAATYPQSIFYETATDGGFATEYAPIDREVIRLLYHPKMSVGLDEKAVEARLIEILEAE